MIDTSTLQTWLKKKQVFAGSIDGELGPQTWDGIDKVTSGLAYNAGFLPIFNTPWEPERRRVAAEQLFLEEQGFDVGEIDGYSGVKTQLAYEAWIKEVRDHDANIPVKPSIPVKPIRAPAPVPTSLVSKNNWPRQSEVPTYYGEMGQHQRMTTVPYTLYYDKTPVNQISLHETCSPSAVRVLTKVLKIYGAARIASLGLNKYSGSLNVRKMRGGDAWSMHSWGIAIDFDAGNNPLAWDHTRARFAKPEYVQWWQCWEEEGWVSLGRARDFDWMHVQAARL